MTAQHLPQADLDAAEASVMANDTEAELNVSNVRGVGTLLLRFRPGKSGVNARWMIRFQEGSRRPTIPLAAYSKRGVNGLTLKGAKQQFDAWVEQREAGVLLVKPKGRAAAELKTREEHAPVPAGQTLAALVDCWLEEYRKVHNQKQTYKTDKYLMDNHLSRRGLGAMRANKVTARDVVEVVKEIADEAGKAYAERFRANLRAIFNMAAKVYAGGGSTKYPARMEAFEIESHNIHLIDEVEGAKRARNQPMDGEMLAPVYAALAWNPADSGGRPTARLLRATLRLSLLLGGSRFEQVNRLTAADFDFATRQVTMRDKKGRHSREARVYQLPLTSTAVQVAQEMLAERAKGHKLNGATFGAAMKRAMERAGVRTAQAQRQGRDVRSTIATWWNLEEQQVRREANNYIQSHGKQMEDAHYIEGSKMERELRRALEKLEALLLGQPMQLAA